MKRRRATRRAGASQSYTLISDSEEEEEVVPRTTHHRHTHFEVNALGQASQKTKYFETPSSPTRKDAPLLREDLPMPDSSFNMDGDDGYAHEFMEPGYRFLFDDDHAPTDETRRTRTASVRILLPLFQTAAHVDDHTYRIIL